MKATQLLPKRVRRLARRSKHASTYESYEAAAADCCGSDYGDGLIESVVFGKTVAYRDRLVQLGGSIIGDSATQAILPLSLAYRGLDRPLAVLDFGGACGAHYFTVRAMLDGQFALRWHVVETAQMAQRAQSLASQELQFFSSITDARDALGHCDVVHASGALQYVPDPYAALKQLLACRAPYLALTRLGVAMGDYDVITIQQSRLGDHGPGLPSAGLPDHVTRTPLTFPSKRRIDSMVENEYRILITIPERCGAFPVGQQQIAGYAMVAERL